jgi:uncharacterized membrane protein YphA (DoxX/SURF4 family)
MPTYPGMAELAVAVRTMIALMFIAASWFKLRHLAVFHGVVANYRLLPQVLAAPFAYLLPPVEALLGAALLLNVAAPWPAAGSIALLLTFAAAMAINLRRGRRDIDCGCFRSELKQSLSWKLVIRNLGLSALLALAAPIRAVPSDALMAVNAWLAGGALFIILQSLTLLSSIVPSWRPRASAMPDGRRSPAEMRS